MVCEVSWPSEYCLDAAIDLLQLFIPKPFVPGTKFSTAVPRVHHSRTCVLLPSQVLRDCTASIWSTIGHSSVLLKVYYFEVHVVQAVAAQGEPQVRSDSSTDLIAISMLATGECVRCSKTSTYVSLAPALRCSTYCRLSRETNVPIYSPARPPVQCAYASTLANKRLRP